jgi:hypothetical protein
MAAIPDELAKTLCLPKHHVMPDHVELSRRIVFAHDEFGTTYDNSLSVKYFYACPDDVSFVFPNQGMSQLNGGKVTVAAAFGDLASAEHDKAWLSVLNSAGRFYGGARPEQYSAGDAACVVALAHREMQPFRFLMRLAALYLGTHLCDIGATKKGSRWLAGSEVRHLKAAPQHGALLEEAAANNRDVVYLPTDALDIRVACAVLAAATATEFPYGAELMLSHMWPGLRRPIVAYCAKEANHSNLDETRFTTAEVYQVATVFAATYGWSALWDQALKLVAMYATRNPDFRVAFGGDAVIQPLPASNLTPLALGPMAVGATVEAFSCPREHGPDHLLVEGAVRHIFLGVSEASALEAMGGNYLTYKLKGSLEGTLLLRMQSYNEGTICGKIASLVAGRAGWVSINDGPLFYRTVQISSARLRSLFAWERYPGWVLAATFGSHVPSGTTADSLVTMAKITEHSKISNSWMEVGFKGESPQRALASMQLIGGSLKYIYSTPDYNVKSILVSRSHLSGLTYTANLPISLRTRGKRVQLVFKADDVASMYEWNSKVKLMSESAKFVVPTVTEGGLWEDGEYESDLAEALQSAPTYEGSYEPGFVNAVKQAVEDVRPRGEVLQEELKEWFPTLAAGYRNFFAGTSGAAATNGDSLVLALNCLKTELVWQDVVAALKPVPMAERHRAAQQLVAAASVLESLCPTATERAEAEAYKQGAINAASALRDNPALTIEEFRLYTAGSAASKVSWPKVPDMDAVGEAVRSGTNFGQWLLRHNPGFEPELGPHSTAGAKKKQAEIVEVKAARQAEAAERLAVRLSERTARLEETASETAKSGEVRADQDPGPGRPSSQDFPSQSSSVEDPSPSSGGAPVASTSAGPGAITFTDVEVD